MCLHQDFHVDSVLAGVRYLLTSSDILGEDKIKNNNVHRLVRCIKHDELMLKISTSSGRTSTEKNTEWLGDGKFYQTKSVSLLHNCIIILMIAEDGGLICV